VNNIVAQFGKIAAKSFLAWLKVIVGGGLLSIICLIVSIVLISNNPSLGFAGARAGIVGAIMAIPYLFVVEFWTALLLFGSIGAMVFYVSFAATYGVQKAIQLTWDSKLGDVLMSKLEQYLSQIFDRKNKPEIEQQDVTTIKRNVVLEIKNDKDNSTIQKRILQYLLKRVKLNDIDFASKDLNIKAIIIGKVKEFVADKVQATMQPFWIVFVLQSIVLVLALVFDHN